MSRSDQRASIDRRHPSLSISEQCAALGLARSTLYYKPREAKEEDLRIMRLMDELHLEDPTRGTRRLCDELVDLGVKIGRDKVRTPSRTVKSMVVMVMARSMTRLRSGWTPLSRSFDRWPRLKLTDFLHHHAPEW